MSLKILVLQVVVELPVAYFNDTAHEVVEEGAVVGDDQDLSLIHISGY